MSPRVAAPSADHFYVPSSWDLKGIRLLCAFLVHIIGMDKPTALEARPRPRPDVMDPKAVEADLKAVVPIIWAALEVGTLKAREYFDEKGLEVDSFLFPNLVRFEAKLHLLAAGQDVFETEILSNNGLVMRHLEYQLRLLKSDHGELPTPGHSRRKQAYYSQQLEFFAPLADEPVEMVNLVVLWDVDSNWNLSGLDLVYPKSGGHTKASVSSFWDIPLEHPVISLDSASVTTVDVSDDEFGFERKVTRARDRDHA